MTKNEDRINKLFKELVPDTGKADSLAGELVRAMSRIGYRFYNDGDQLGIGYGKETCNPAGRFLGAKGNDKIAKLTADAWAVCNESSGSSSDSSSGQRIRYCRAAPGSGYGNQWKSDLSSHCTSEP